MKYKKSTWLFSFAIVAGFGFMYSMGSRLGYAIPEAVQQSFGFLIIVLSVAGKLSEDREKKSENKNAITEKSSK